MAGVTPRGQLPYNEGGDPPDTDGQVRLLAERLAAIIAIDDQGLAADRPLAGVEGRYWFSTDTGALSRDNGSSWSAIGALNAAGIPYAGSTDLAATNVEAALDELDAEKLSVTAANAAYVARGTTDAATTELRAALVETHERSTTNTYTGGKLTQVVEKAGAATVRTTTLNYTGDQLTSTVEVVGGKTITSTLVYTGANLTGTTRTVA